MVAGAGSDGLLISKITDAGLVLRCLTTKGVL